GLVNSQHNPLLVDADSVLRAAADRGLSLPGLIWDATCSSTNDELARLVRDGGAGAGQPAECTIRGTDFQTAGHGRPGRSGTVPGRRSLTWSMLLARPAGLSQWGWIAIIAGEGVRAAVAEAGGPAVIKWPKEVLTEGGKELCGTLARIESGA